MARSRNPKGVTRLGKRTQRTTHRRLNESTPDIPEYERNDLDEIEDRYQDVDKDDFPEAGWMEEEGEESEENFGENEFESEEEDHIAGPSLTRRRHHAREDVNRVGRIKQRSTGFSSNGHQRNRKVSLRGQTGTRSSLRRTLASPERETRRERSQSARLTRRQVASVETKAATQRRRTSSPVTAKQQKYSGNGQAGLRSTAKKKLRDERTHSPLRATRRRER